MVLSAGAEQNTQHTVESVRVGEIINYGEHLNAPGWFPGRTQRKKRGEKERHGHASLSHLFSHTPQHTHDLYIYMSCLSPSERVFTRAFLTSQSRRVLIISYHAPRRSACSFSAASLPTKNWEHLSHRVWEKAPAALLWMFAVKEGLY